MNYEDFKLSKSGNKHTAPTIQEPNYFKGSISPKPSTLSSGNMVVYLYDEINEVSVNRVISELLPLIGTGKTVQLRLKTFGGSLYDCFALIEIIRQYKIPVHVDGYAMSGGFLIFAAAEVRTMSPYSYLMYHDMTYIEYGKRATHQNELEHSNRLAKMYHDLICEYTKVTPKMLKEWDDKQLEWYLDYNDAKKLGVVTQELREVEFTVPATESSTGVRLEYVDIVTETKKTSKNT